MENLITKSVLLTRVVPNSTKKGEKYLTVQTNEGEYISCFDAKWFPALEGSEGKTVKMRIVEKGRWKNVVGIESEANKEVRFAQGLDEDIHREKQEIKEKAIRYGNALNALGSLYAGSGIELEIFLSLVDKAAEYLKERSTE